MRMHDGLALTVFALALCLCVFVMPRPAAGSPYVGLLQSAETVEPGTIKIMIAPIYVFEKDEVDGEFGAGARLGYGFTDRFDAEAKLGFLENHTLLGGDLEYWAVKAADRASGVDLSLGGGFHYVLGSDDALDTMGFELTPQAGLHLGEVLEVCGALDFSFESIQDAPEGIDDSYTLVHAVPGFEYKLSEEADLVGEVGIGLNDDSFSYAGLGICFYLR